MGIESECQLSDKVQVSSTCPRKQDHLFSHHVIPKMLAGNPESFIRSLIAQGDTLLLRIWNEIGNKCDACDNVQPVQNGVAFDLNIEVKSGQYSVVIKMPRCCYAAEAHLIGIIATKSQQLFSRDSSSSRPAFRYFVVEHAGLPGEDAPGVLLEWHQGHFVRLNGTLTPDSEHLGKYLAGRSLP